MFHQKTSSSASIRGAINKNLRDGIAATLAVAVGLGMGVVLSNLPESDEATVAGIEKAERKEESTAKVESTAEQPPADTPEAPVAGPGFAKVDSSAEIAAIDPAEPVIIKNPPVEKTGGMGSPEERLPDQAQVPEEVIESCDKYFSKTLNKELRLKAKEGPLQAGFTVEFDGVLNPWSLMTVSKLPKDLLSVIIVDAPDSKQYKMEAEAGKIVQAESNSFRWEAPEEPGIYCVRILEEGSDRMMCLHVATLKPWDGESEYLDGFRIGKYEDKPYKDNPRYSKPRGFIQVTEENKDTWLSPHLQLSQFICKQKSDYPKYLLVDTRLLLKLEKVIDELNKKGRDTSNLYISSGFRTPYYNKSLGNKTSYSRHLYGDAADMFVDSNRDGKIDDLDFDGSRDDDDAKIIHKTIQEVTSDNKVLVGGLGFYSKERYVNPFIHVDTRGYAARWYK